MRWVLVAYMQFYFFRDFNKATNGKFDTRVLIHSLQRKTNQSQKQSENEAPLEECRCPKPGSKGPSQGVGSNTWQFPFYKHDSKFLLTNFEANS
jgi:hypothetical protein